MDKRKKLYCVANAHLDTQWNWTIRDTIRDCIKNTLEQNFELFEKYPHYRMNFEGAFRYKLAKEYYPDLYEKLKRYIAEGRWNVAGSQWDACDANLPSSEAYMRQILLGNGFFEKEFGKRSTDIFLSDCFGFRYSLPSIAAHMGLNGFSTQKLTWGVGSPIYNGNNTTRRPMPEEGAERMDLGRWVGPDGNSVIASFLGGNYTLHFEADEAKRPIHDREEYLRDIEHNEKHTGMPVRMMYYGVGDYGGAPSEESAAYINEAVEANSPDKAFDVVAGSTDDIFNDLTPEEIAALPEYNGNLLIPHGYGALTSHTISKRWNRKSELLADSCERAASMAARLGKAAYPKARLEAAWKTFLWHQFHDDLPGTSIVDAYTFTYNDYVIAMNMLAEELVASVDAVASALDTDVSGTPVVVYNPVSVRRTDIAEAPLPDGVGCARVYNADGTEVPSQISANENGKKTVKFAATVAPVSCTVFNVVPSASPCDMKTGLSVDPGKLENARYCVKLNDDGYVSSVTDKKNSRELLSAPISFGVRDDSNTNCPSWEINYEDTKLPFADVSGLCSVEISENGPALAALTVTRSENGSEYRQTVSLVAGGDRVDFDNDVDWHCRHSLLSAAFPLAVSNEKAMFDLGLGAEAGGNTTSFPYFQHLVHQWADLTDKDGSFGVAVLNDCKYGMEKPDDNTLRLTLIHTPLGAFMAKSAQNWQDSGRNIFRFSVTSHGGERDGVASEAAAFNQPLMAFTSAKHAGKSDIFSFASVSNDAAVIKAVKQEEKGDRLIVRIQETSGRTLDNVVLALDADILSAVETNGYEEEIGTADVVNNGIVFALTAYAVKTFAITIRKAPEALPVEIPVALEYNKRVTTSDADRDDGEFANGISIPEELFDKNVECGGIRFVMGEKGRENALVCRGNTIRLPEGATKLAILAASAGRDKRVEFTAAGRKTAVTVQDFSADIGAWDIITREYQPMIKPSPLAVNYTHTHDRDGNRLYMFANIFKYVVDIDGAEEITLPDDPDIIIMAATAYNGFDTEATAPLYDAAQRIATPVHTLTVDNAIGGGEYHEGSKTLVRAEITNKDGLFEGWGGDADIVFTEGTYAVIRMGSTDARVYPVYTAFGENVVYNKPCKASGKASDGEAGGMALNGDSTSKWCASGGKDNVCWLEVDIGEVVSVSGWLVLHCGAMEGNAWNTSDFCLQYKEKEEDEWKLADDVKGNIEDMTMRNFTPVNARYVRLYITKAERHEGDSYCRIYQLHVYRNE